MRIPSYDDLTPSIPDIPARETFAEIGKFLPRADPPEVAPSPVAAFTPSSPLYACVCDPRGAVRSRTPHPASRIPDPGSRISDAVRLAAPHTPRHFLIARDFSPRIHRHGDSSVVLDISGLGGLLGNPHAIGAELARAAEGDGGTLRIA